MLNAQELKGRINDQNVRKLLELLGAEIYCDTEDFIISNTICHHGSKKKLYYYKDSCNNKSKYEKTNIFKCYTDCGDTFDIIELVCRNKRYSFTEAINWICIQLGFSTLTYGFGIENEKINDWVFIGNLLNRRKKKKNVEYNDFYDRNILNIFQNMYLKDWINEGISIDSLLKYEIKYSTLQQKVIIPHYNEHYQLMGVRTRATDEEEIESYGKYTPFQLHNITYSHPISQNLYGIHINKETIKRKKKIMLVEGEKSVLQCDTMFGDENFTVALCGNNLSDFQRDMIVSLGVNEVIIALDKQFTDANSEEADNWAKHIKEKFINKLAPYCVTTVLWDSENLLPYKASPTDLGKDVLLKLMDSKIYVTCG